uniref:UPF0182 protein Sfum_2137 n=1 Tax=Zeugodacus cucurbitae TaxID=28588 RepID=A0A0A1X086_ZEUCU
MVAIPAALRLRHLFAFALLIFAALPVTPAKMLLEEHDTAAVTSAKQGAENAASSRGQAVIDAVPMAERAAFIRYHLAKAMNRFNATANNATGRSIEPRLFLDPNAVLSPEQLLAFENIPTYAEFGEDVFYWMRDRLQVAEDELYALIDPRSGNVILCTYQGICYAENDIGYICCPF